VASHNPLLRNKSTEDSPDASDDLVHPVEVAHLVMHPHLESLGARTDPSPGRPFAWSRLCRPPAQHQGWLDGERIHAVGLMDVQPVRKNSQTIQDRICDKRIPDQFPHHVPSLPSKLPSVVMSSCPPRCTEGKMIAYLPENLTSSQIPYGTE
jgi:hypothetical protein